MEENVYSFEYINPYDVIADLIVHLRKLDPDAYRNKHVRDTELLSDDIKDVSEAFLRKLKSFSRKAVVCGIHPEDRDTLKDWRFYDDFSYMLEFLAAFSRRIPCDEILRSEYVKMFRNGFRALNDNCDATGIYILPKVRTINDSLEPTGYASKAVLSDANSKTWADMLDSGINFELANIYYIEDDALNIDGRHFSIINNVINDGYYWTGKESLVIAMSPIAYADLLQIKKYTKPKGKKRTRCFSIEGIKDEALVKKRIKTAYVEACKNEADIIVFPEMLGTEEIVGDVFFQELRYLAEKETEHMPILILLPTWWHDHSNELYVRKGYGKCICTQRKIIPFPYKSEDGKQYIEDLAEEKPVIHIVHIPELGRIVFMICRDFLANKFLDTVVEEIRPTLLLCPSFSSGKLKFRNNSLVPIRYGAYTAWINTCAAYEDRNEIDYVGFVSGPQEGENPVELLRPVCNGDCNGIDSTCVFLVRISMNQGAIIKHEHIWKASNMQ